MSTTVFTFMSFVYVFICFSVKWHITHRRILCVLIVNIPQCTWQMFCVGVGRAADAERQTDRPQTAKERRKAAEQPVFLLIFAMNAFVCALWYVPNPPWGPLTPFSLLAFPVQAPHPRHPGDASLQGLPRGQHHPPDPAVQGVGQVQRGELDGEQDLRWTVDSM